MVAVVPAAKSTTQQAEVEELAGLLDGLAHPFRAAIYRVLKREGAMPVAELRRQVGEEYASLDARNLLFHLFKMQSSGIVSVRKEQGRDVARLVLEVVVRTKRVE